jgi:hypothetical protein
MAGLGELHPRSLARAENEGATTNAVFLGLGVALIGHFEASFAELAAEWLNIAAGLWLIIAPFLLGFTAEPLATANSITVGTILIGLVASASSLDKELGKWWHNRFAGH